jgi:hypothetical protein
MTGPVRVRIDRLTLIGVAPGDAAAVQRALRQAIATGLAHAERPIAGARARLSLAVAPGEGAAALGAAAGRAIAGAVAGRRR